MAVFFLNVCKFNSCGRTFPSLQDLIQHIEYNHIDEDKILNNYQGGAYSLPLSSVLRICSNLDDIKSELDLTANTLVEPHVRKQINSPVVSLVTTDVCEFDAEGDNDSDSGHSSIDSWVANSDSNQLLKYHSLVGQNGQNLDENNNSSKLNKPDDRLYVCGMAGCNKRYRNPNGLTHHRRTVHKVPAVPNASTKPPVVDQSTRKVYNCDVCKKTYKTSHGLKNHYTSHHSQTTSMQPSIKQESISTNSFVQIKTESMDTLSSPLPRLGLASSTTHELTPDLNCPPVTNSVEISTSPKPPPISAPTLQKHLLSPIIPKQIMGT